MGGEERANSMDTRTKRVIIERTTKGIKLMPEVPNCARSSLRSPAAVMEVFAATSMGIYRKHPGVIRKESRRVWRK